MFELIPFERRSHLFPTFDPFRELEEFERSFWGNSRINTAFRTDVIDTGDAYKLEAELPGFNKDDIKIDLDNDCITITAEHSAENKNDDRSGYVKRERYYGSYVRTFDVSGVNTDAIEAEYSNGILTLTMPKKEEEIPASRRLEIK